jgi:hypothetical protein
MQRDGLPDGGAIVIRKRATLTDSIGRFSGQTYVGLGRSAPFKGEALHRSDAVQTGK